MKKVTFLKHLEITKKKKKLENLDFTQTEKFCPLRDTPENIQRQVTVRERPGHAGVAELGSEDAESPVTERPAAQGKQGLNI